MFVSCIENPFLTHLTTIQKKMILYIVKTVSGEWAISNRLARWPIYCRIHTTAQNNFNFEYNSKWLPMNSTAWIIIIISRPYLGRNIDSREWRMVNVARYLCNCTLNHHRALATEAAARILRFNTTLRRRYQEGKYKSNKSFNVCTVHVCIWNEIKAFVKCVGTCAVRTIENDWLVHIHIIYTRKYMKESLWLISVACGSYLTH